MRKALLLLLVLAGLGTAAALAAVETPLLVPYLATLGICGLVVYLITRRSTTRTPQKSAGWSYLNAVGLVVVGAGLVVLAQHFIRRLQDTIAMTAFFVGIIFIVGGLARLGWLLMNSRTAVGWRAAVKRLGGAAAFIGALAVTVAVVFLMMRMYDPDLNIMNPGPDSYHVEHRARITFEDGDFVTAREEYVIRPASRYSAVGVEEIESLAIPREDVLRAGVFTASNDDGVPMSGYETEFERLIPLEVEQLGFLRSKYTLTLPAIQVISRDERRGSADSLSVSSDSTTISLARMLELESRLTIDMPRNSVTSVYPPSTVEHLPDRDVIFVTPSRLETAVEVYYLRTFRTPLMRKLLSTSSEGEVLLEGVAWLFWPVVTIIIGTFRAGLADRISGWFRRKKKPRSPMGFRLP